MSTRLRDVVRLIALVPPALGLSGCVVFAWAAAVATPPPKIPPVYKPPQGKTILVLVDDLRSPVHYQPIKRELAERLNRKLVGNKVARRTIDYERLVDFIAATPSFNRMPVGSIGRQLGADLVLYVEIRRFSLKDEQVVPLWRGRLATSARIVDVREGLLWPKDRAPREGFPVPPVETTPTHDTSVTYGEKLSEELAEKMADRIARLFYEHEQPADSGWDGGR